MSGVTLPTKHATYQIVLPIIYLYCFKGKISVRVTWTDVISPKLSVHGKFDGLRHKRSLFANVLLTLLSSLDTSIPALFSNID